MTIDMSSLLQRPAGKAIKPQALPVGDYAGIIKSYEFGDNNQNRTPYVRFQLGLIDWPDAVPADERGQSDDAGTFHPTDLSKKTFRRDFYLTDDALFRLDDLIKSCGAFVEGESYEAAIPKLIGSRVTVEVQQYVNQRTNDVGNQVGRIAAAV